MEFMPALRAKEFRRRQDLAVTSGLQRSHALLVPSASNLCLLFAPG